MSKDLLKLVSKGDVAQVSDVFKSCDEHTKKEILNTKDADGNTALHVAAQPGHTEICRLLLDSGAQTEVKNSTGLTPLYLAARHGHADVVSVLLASGANPNAQDGQEATVIQKACELQLDEVALLLASHKSTQLDAQDLMGRTALHWCASKGSAAVAAMIVDNGGKMLKTKGGETPLHWASRAGHDAIVSCLLAKFPVGTVYARSERNETTIDLAANESIRNLLKAHAESVGETDTSASKIDTAASSVSIKKIAPPSSGAAKKKMTINLKK